MNNFPKSIKRFIRSEKAKIRRDIFDVKQQEEMINELYKRFIKGVASNLVAKAPEKKKEKAVKSAQGGSALGGKEEGPKTKKKNTRKPRDKK